MIHAAEWGAALAVASVGTQASLEWRMVACGLIAAMSIGRVRRERTVAMAPASTHAPASAAAQTPVATPAPKIVTPAPPARVEAAAVQPKLESARTSIAMPTPRAGSVLLAEDDPDNQMLVATQLRRLNYMVTIAGNGRAAVDLAIAAECAGEPFDIVLMDMQMPEMDGLAAARAIREAEAESGTHVPIVALTANALERDRNACIDAGMDDYLSKPLQLEALRAALERWIPVTVK